MNEALFAGVDSLQVPVPSLEEGLAFYGQLTGGAIRWRTSNALALAMADGTEVVLQTERPAPETDVLVEDAERAAASFVRAGGVVVVEPFDIAVGRAAVVSDPWGTRWVLVDLSKGTLDTDGSGRVTGVSKKAADLDPAPSAAALPKPSAIPDVYVLVRRSEEILLLLRSGTGYKDGQWGPPSGKVEAGETYSEAAARELGEETGIQVSPEQLGFVHVVERLPTSGSRWIGLFFEVDAGDAAPVNLEPDKHEALGFFPVSGLPENTVDYVRHVLEATARGERHSAWRYDAVEDSQ